MIVPLPPTPQFGGDPVSDNTVAIISVISIFVMSPVAFALARLIWRRGSAPESRSLQNNDELSRRMIEMQHSIDSMAVEIERISEGQRFVTKVLTERPAGALPAQAGRSREEGGRS